MKRSSIIWVALALGGGLLLWPGHNVQADTTTVIMERLRPMDRDLEWGLIYYQSWLKEKNPNYMALSRRYLRQAVTDYWRLLNEVNYGFPSFYIVDQRRRKGCDYLRELWDVARRNNQLPENEPKPEGCNV